MLKLSKYYVVKNAEDKNEELGLSGAQVEDDADDLGDGLEQEGLAGEDKERGKEELEAAKSPKFDPRQEAATPHAHAAKDLFSKRRALLSQMNMLDDQLSKHREVLRALDPKVKHESYADDKELRDYLRPEKMDDKKKKRKKLDKAAEVEIVSGLLKVADVLDYAGDKEGVSLIESMLNIFAKKEDGMPKYDVQTIEKEKKKYPELPPVAPSLSVRGCPDHNGVQMQRVGEGIWRCELDGRQYDWNEGFKDYSGNNYPAAPIRSVDFPDTTERLFQTRQMAQSKNVK